MTNNFSTIKTYLTSEKFILARIRPGREISGDMTLDSGTIYKMTFPFDSVCRIEVNGTSFTKVSGTPGASQYSFDTSTRLLKIELGTNISTYQTSGAIVAFYYLFYTNEIGRYAYEDPEDSSTTLRFWEPRIDGFPGFVIDQEDVIDGFLSIGNTSLELKNKDSNFQQYLTDNDSFSKKEIKIWQCLDNLENIKKFFFGVCDRITLSSDSVNISIDNLFGSLNNTYTPKDTLDDSTYRNTNFTVREEDKDKSILKLFCLVTRTSEQPSDQFKVGGILSSGSLQGYYVFADACKAVNVNYNETQSTSNNRDWAACIESTSSSEHSEVLAGKTASSIGGTTLQRFTVADANKYRPGDNVKINGNVNFYVIEIDTVNNYIYIEGDSALMSNGHTIIRPSISVVQIKAEIVNGVQIYAMLEWENHYTIKTVDGVRVIDLVDNFESDFAFTGDLANGIQPDNEVLFRAWNHDSVEHGTVVQSLIENAGLTVNSSSITTANTTSFKCNFTLPFYGSDKNPSIREALEKLLKSTFGYLSLNSSFEVEYGLFADPSPSTDISENEFLDKSLVQEIDYKDIYTSVEFYNYHGESIFNDRNRNARYLTTSESAVYTSKSKYLHNIDKAKTINHLVLSMTNSKNKIAGVLSKRRYIVSLKTKGINFESKIGDDFTVASDKVLGGSEEKDIKIISIEKRANETVIKGTDLIGIP